MFEAALGVVLFATGLTKDPKLQTSITCLRSLEQIILLEQGGEELRLCFGRWEFWGVSVHQRRGVKGVRASKILQPAEVLGASVHFPILRFRCQVLNP